MKILVTGANGDIGEAIGRILAAVLPGAIVHGADAAGQWPGGFVFAKMIDLPLAAAPDYVERLRAVAAGYDLVIPSSEPELYRLAQTDNVRRQLPLLMVQANLLTTFMDKYDTVQFFNRHGLPAPVTKLLADVGMDELPVYVKPRRGAGGRGHFMVRTVDELKQAQQRHDDNLVAQQYLAGDDNEYTCALTRLQGRIQHLILKRKLHGDKTVRAEVVDSHEIAALLGRLATVTDLDGCINVQLKMTNSGPMVFEINPRLSSTVMMRHQLGFNDCEKWVRSFLGLELLPTPAPRIGDVVYRMSTEYVVPR